MIDMCYLLAKTRQTLAYNKVSCLDVSDSYLKIKAIQQTDRETDIQYNTIICNAHKVEYRTSNLRLGQSLGGRGCGALVNWDEM